MDTDRYRSGHDHDTHARVFLRRAGAQEEYPLHPYAVHGHSLRDFNPVGTIRLQPGFRPGQGRLNRRSGVAGAGGCRPRAARNLYEHCSAPAIHGVPNDVRRYHPGAHHRSVRGAYQIFRVSAIYHTLASPWFTTRLRTGSGQRTDGSLRWAPWISREEL